MYGASEPTTKAVVSVAEMARMVGLSRSTFLPVDRDDLSLAVLRLATRRPFYTRFAKGLPRSSSS